MTNSNADPEPIIPPRARRGQKKAQPDSDQLDVPSQHPPVEPDIHGPEKPRPRGRPRGAPIPASAPLENVPSMPTAADTHGSGRKTRPHLQEPDDAPPSKRKKGEVVDSNPSPAKQKPSRQRLPKVMLPREPLPDRTGRNVHPVKPKATRRTAQEVAADREAHIRELEEKIRVAEEAKELLAQMNVNEELDDERMLVDNPQRLSAAIRKRGRELLEDSEAEDFDFDAAEKGSYSDDEAVEPVKRKTVSCWPNIV